MLVKRNNLKNIESINFTLLIKSKLFKKFFMTFDYKNKFKTKLYFLFYKCFQSKNLFTS